jgi:UDP-GlcNAc:undecaprenyl-phosphate GlcNAc-1-phosphate transferase
MVGGKDHTTHHMVYSGKNDRQVWMIFTSIGFFSAFLSVVIIMLVINDYPLATLAFIPYFWLVFFYLYRNTIKFPEPTAIQEN